MEPEAQGTAAGLSTGPSEAGAPQTHRLLEAEPVCPQGGALGPERTQEDRCTQKGGDGTWAPQGLQGPAAAESSGQWAQHPQVQQPPAQPRCGGTPGLGVLAGKSLLQPQQRGCPTAKADPLTKHAAGRWHTAQAGLLPSCGRGTH